MVLRDGDQVDSVCPNLSYYQPKDDTELPFCYGCPTNTSCPVEQWNLIRCPWEILSEKDGRVNKDEGDDSDCLVNDDDDVDVDEDNRNQRTQCDSRNQQMIRCDSDINDEHL